MQQLILLIHLQGVEIKLLYLLTPLTSKVSSPKLQLLFEAPCPKSKAVLSTMMESFNVNLLETIQHQSLRSVANLK
jgi:hypothetical protein